MLVFMSEYLYLRTTSLSFDVQQRKAARRKVIERAQQIELESYKAHMRKKRQLHAAAALDTMV